MLRQLYRPVQPTVGHLKEHVAYREIAPAPRLQPFIFCYWELVSKTKPESPFQYQVVADGCTDIFFEVANPLQGYVMGFCDSHTSFSLQQNFHYIGIRFYPGVFSQLYRVNASELSNRSENLDAISSLTAQVLSQVEPPVELEAIKHVLDNHFDVLFSKTTFKVDPRFYNALDIILQHKGNIRIEADLDTGLSPRQLRRLFGNYIGGSAKAFSKVVRFQQLLQSFTSGANMQQGKVFLDHYYDQAHFIKEFKQLYGTTPGQAFDR